MTAVRKLNDNEELLAELASHPDSGQQSIHCKVMRNGELILGFRVNEKGLEDIGFGSLEFSFGGSKRIRLQDGLGIGYPGALTSLHINEEDRKNYQDVADRLAIWMEYAIFQGKIEEVPASFMRDPRSPY